MSEVSLWNNGELRRLQTALTGLTLALTVKPIMTVFTLSVSDEPCRFNLHHGFTLFNVINSPGVNKVLWGYYFSSILKSEQSLEESTMIQGKENQKYDGKLGPLQKKELKQWKICEFDSYHYHI